MVPSAGAMTFPSEGTIATPLPNTPEELTKSPSSVSYSTVMITLA
jgi:hypothetical protein